MPKLEVTIDVIVHATENLNKYFETFSDMFALREESFEISHLHGHYDNPITTLKAKLIKKEASDFMKKISEKLSEIQKREIMKEINERIENSTLHIRLDKQEFIQGKIELREKEAIRLKIHTPIYNKKETFNIFNEILNPVN